MHMVSPLRGEWIEMICASSARLSAWSRLSEARHAAVFARFPGFLFLLRTEQVDWNDVIST